MHFCRNRVLSGQADSNPFKAENWNGNRLRSLAAVALTLASCMPSGYAQQSIKSAGSSGPDKAASTLPSAPAPELTEPFNLRTTSRDFSKAYANFFGAPWKMYGPTSIPKGNFANSVRLDDLLKDGKIYLSLSDAIALAIENNFDIAIARYNLDIADTDILRTRTGAVPLGAPSGLVTGTLGGSTSTLTTGGGPGGTTVGAGGAGSAVGGLTLTTAGTGPLPVQFDPAITGAIEFERQKSPEQNIFTPRAFNNSNTYNFTYTQGFAPGTLANLTWDNSRITSNGFNSFSPQLSANFRATVTQHLLEGAGIWVNKRFMYTALNNKRITDSSFRQQLLYTVNQVETIYWGLVQAYEDVQAKERALNQSSQLLSDNQKQLQIGTMAPLDVVNAQSNVASDRQALITAQNALNYQQQIIKQAIARNLNDPGLSAAPVIPTDRVSLEPLSEEGQSVESLVQAAFKQRPELEQAALTVRNDEITLRGSRNGLLPTLDAYAFYGGSGIGGQTNVNCVIDFGTGPIPCGGTTTSNSYSNVLSNTVNGSSPDKGVGFNFQLTLRNREAQSIHERSLMEYRQAELRLEQLYTQIRMQVVNQMYALTNDRASVMAAEAARDYNEQSLDAEVKKLRLGASTTANVLQQERNLAVADDNLIVAHATYAKDRSSLYQILASTLQHYGINLEDSARGVVTTAPVVPGVTAVKPGNEPSMAPPVDQPAPPTQQTPPGN